MLGPVGVPLSGTDWRIFPFRRISQMVRIETIGEDGTGKYDKPGPQVMKEYLNKTRNKPLKQLRNGMGNVGF